MDLIGRVEFRDPNPWRKQSGAITIQRLRWCIGNRAGGRPGEVLVF